MDETPGYILQCEKAKELQSAWQPCEWDYIFCKFDKEVVVLSGYPTDSGVYGHGILVGDECPSRSFFQQAGETREHYKSVSRWIAFKEDHIWLPRQDQLQRMLDERFSNSHPWILAEKFSHFARPSNLERKVFDMSMEQLWLAFTLAEKFNKVWSGTDWLKGD